MFPLVQVEVEEHHSVTLTVVAVEETLVVPVVTVDENVVERTA